MLNTFLHIKIIIQELMTIADKTHTTKISTPSNALSNIVPLNLTNCLGSGVGEDGEDGDDLGHKITISVHRGKKMITKIEGIPNKFNLFMILKKLKSKDVLSCGGHIANDKETGNDFIVLQGSFPTETATFLTQEGIVDGRSIIHRG